MHKRSILRLAVLALVTHGAAARAAEPPDPVKDWTQGVLVAVNELFGARSGWSWVNPPEPVRGIVGTLVPVPALTQVVNVSHPGMIVPCIRVTLESDAEGATTYTLVFDETMIDHFQITNLKGEAFRLVPDTRGGE